MKNYVKRKSNLKMRVGLTLGMLLFVTALSGIPTPGIQPGYLKILAEQYQGLGFISILSGKGFGNAAISMLSVTPYITSSIILQLMAYLIPKLDEIKKDGEAGKKKYESLTVLLGIVLGIAESLVLAYGFGRRSVGGYNSLLINNTWYGILTVSIIWTMVSLLIVLIGNLITKHGIGNGISLILLCNILSTYPSDIREVIQFCSSDKKLILSILAAFLFLLLVIVLFYLAILLGKTEKRIPVTYSNKYSEYQYKNRDVFSIPICPGGVVPAIFAQTILSIPSLIESFSGKSFAFARVLESSFWFHRDKPWYSLGVILYIVLIFAFSFFYQDLVLNPNDIAHNFKKSGGMIPGIRPGKPTTEYIERKMYGAILFGAFGLTLIALVPCILSGVFGLGRLSFAGTSILITTSVILETYDLLKADSQSKKMRVL